MPASGDQDALVLGALECYQRAVTRVAEDFARRGALVQPLDVDLDILDALIVRYRTRGEARESWLGSLPVTSDLERAVAELADMLQEEEFDEGDISWPGCTAGDTHPPTAAVVDGVACWQCPRSRAVLSRIL
ncbi:hypothetical protein DKT68_02405 [Micromonospora acroterricola]|uniref:Uncharacterized protein n=1 Tax=Micromonospora acroterricola TaxID=2202421 RepID=A0A317DDI0_9ACTN|nr:hypothetical protein [Micromonospora acroterricola]PWR12798.1 hypothetical protein DKT68_02405 [Micromonospora acroterricola]